MDKTIKDVFTDECARLSIDAKLAKRIHAYQAWFANKNEEHTTFFGGNLTGVQVVRFTSSDRARWFDDVLEADDVALEERLLQLESVNPEFKIASDTMNLSCAWLLHALHESTKLDERTKHQAMIDVLLVLQFKFLTSLMFQYFKYPAQKDVAEATYARLTYRYAIKQHGNWMAVLLARAVEVISQQSIHRKAIETMDDDAKVTYMLSDTQGRIRDMLKNIYAVFIETHSKGIKISSTSMIVEHDGESVLKDRNNSLLSYGRYLNSVVSDKASFIREELCQVIEKIMPTMPPRLFLMTLEWMSENYRQQGAKVIEDVLNEVLIHSFEYLSENRGLIKNNHDLPGLLARLQGVYMSSRSTDPALLELRKNTEKIVTLATQNRNQSVMASVRTGVLLYLVARAMTMRYYSSSSTAALTGT